MKPLMFIMSKETLLEKINALEPCMRAYIHEIESKCDPSGDIRTIADLREQVRALQLKVEEKESNPFNCKKRHWGLIDCLECGLTADEQGAFPAIIPERFKHLKGAA